MTSRLLALVLTLIMGSPICWCCAQAAPKPEKAKHSCCEKSESDGGRSSAPSPKDPCPCGASMIRREMAKTIIDVPPSFLNGLDLAPVCGPVVLVVPLVTQDVPYFHDTGPPHERPPIFLLQHAFLM